MNRLRGPHFFGQMEATVLAPDEIEEWQMLESWLHCQNGKITKAYIGLHPTQEPFKKTRPSAPLPLRLGPKMQALKKSLGKASREKPWVWLCPQSPEHATCINSCQRDVSMMGSRASPM